MVLTLANILFLPITIFTSISNMPIICILPTTGPTISTQPLFLAYTQTGPGHYDCAVPCESANQPEKEKPVVTKCTCGRKPNMKGMPCQSLRCNCYRSKTKCTMRCVCKMCANEFGVRPLPSTSRRRQTYDNQRQPLKGRSSVDFMAENREVQSEGHFTLLESLLFKMMIIHFILYGLDITPQNMLQAYKKIRYLCNCCNSIEFPLANRTIKNFEHHLSKLYSTIELLKMLVKFSC